ncbi:MAG: multiheme c-type cytochrome [Myxococcaceae bacterium]
MTGRLAVLSVACWLCACDPPRRAWPDAGGAVEAIAEASHESAWGQDSGTPQGKLYPARRCGECHGRQRDEWGKSAHARASSQIFEGTLAKVAEPQQKACLGCHRPLESAGARVAPDGVACDACHTATGAGEQSGGVKLEPALATRFGPYKDSKDHHFHRVGYSAFVTGDALCLSCHQDSSGGAWAVYDTGAEVKASGTEKRCADCHMPGFSAIAAKGEKVRPVAHHDFGGAQGKAPALAAALQVETKHSPMGLTVTLSNHGVPHALPTGRPERRLRLEVHWKGAGDEALGDLDRGFGRMLVDADGKPAPSFLAAKVQSDFRLFDGKPVMQRFQAPPKAAAAVVQVFYEPFDPELSAWFPKAERVLVLERREALTK